MADEAPETVEVWFDPACPWTWTTTRWLVEEVAAQRPISLRWRLMSLALLNEGAEVPPEMAERLAAARRMGRLHASAIERHGEEVLGDLYTEVGTRVHRQGRAFDAVLAAEALTAAGLDEALASSLDEADRDATIRASHDAGQQAVGEPSGSPIIAIGGRGLFGPVLRPLPRGDEALRIFDAVRVLAGAPAFSEMKRARGGAPDPG